jgi:membrane protease YdiL (CAAX protease family)
VTGERSAERELWLVCIVAAVGLLLHEMVFLSYYFPEFAERWLGAGAEELAAEHPDAWSLGRFVWWVGGTFLVWVCLPVLMARRVLGRRLADYGVQRMEAGGLRPYLILAAIAVPTIALATSLLPSFGETYPLYQPEGDAWRMRNILAFEAMYALQFVCVEFFFRGFLVIGLSRAIGHRAVLVSIIPYAMIHIYKPMPEAFGAILAGLLLGALALRSRSIWGGVLVHVAVAWTADAVAILRRGLPEW